MSCYLTQSVRIAAFVAVSFCLRAQGAAQTGATSRPATATQLPLSGRASQGGSVSTTQSTTNAGGANSVNLINSSISLDGQYRGSVSTGAALSNLPISLTLDTALAMGLRNNLGSISQTQSVLQAQGQRLTARSALLPNVSSSISETVQQLNLRTQGINFPGIPAIIGPYNFFDARAGRLTQSVLDFVSLNNLRAATLNVRTTEQAARDARDLVVLAIGGTYLQVITAQARVDTARDQVITSQAIYQQAVDRLNAGLNARIDANRTRVQLQTDEQRLRSVQADLERQKLTLRRVIGMPLGQEFTIADHYPYTPLTGFDLGSALTHAAEARYDLRAAAASLKASEAALSAAHAERLPSLSLTADYGAAGTVPAHSHGTFAVSGTLTIPLYQGGRVQGDVDQAEAAMRQRRAELADIRGQVEQDVRRAFIDLNAAADQVGVAQSNAQLAQETLNQARDRFIAGVADTLEVVQAQQSVAQANNDYIDAVFEHNLAKMSLARALGGAEENLKILFKATKP